MGKLRSPKLGTLMVIQTASIAVLVVSTIVLALVVSNLVSAKNASRRAADKQTVERCFASAASAPRLAHVLEALAKLDISSQARDDLRSFERVSVTNAPTIRECRRLADKLDVPRPKVAT